MKDFNIGDRVTVTATVRRNDASSGTLVLELEDGHYIGLPNKNCTNESVKTFRDQAALSALQGIIVAGPHDCTIPEIAYEAFNYAEALDAERKKRDRGER